jgi:uridine kinase
VPSRSSDPFVEVLAAATERICTAVVAVEASNPVVIIDGRSGAGKTSLTARVIRAWPLRTPVQLVALDSVYPGWSGLEQGAETVRQSLLIPHGRGLLGTWRRWDWELGEEAEAHAVDPALGLVVEGCGALTATPARLGDVTVWVDGPRDSRRTRALARDGDGFRPYWDMWAAQEEAHIARHRPQGIADIVVRTP